MEAHGFDRLRIKRSVPVIIELMLALPGLPPFPPSEAASLGFCP